MNLRGCKEPCRLQYEMLVLFTQFLNDDEIKAIRETFQSIDVDNSGSIEIAELKEAFIHVNLMKLDDEVEQVP